MQVTRRIQHNVTCRCTCICPKDGSISLAWLSSTQRMTDWGGLSFVTNVIDCAYLLSQVLTILAVQLKGSCSPYKCDWTALTDSSPFAELWFFMWLETGWFWGSQSKVTLDTHANTMILIFTRVNIHKHLLYHFVLWCYFRFVSGRLAGLVKRTVICCRQLTLRGLSSSSSPIPNGSLRLQWNKSTSEEAVVGLVCFCCRVGPCAPCAAPCRFLLVASVVWIRHIFKACL